MKKIIMAIAAVMMLSTASAQENERRGGRQGRQFDRTEMQKRHTENMVKQYGLNEEQAKQLEALNLKYADRMGPGMGGFRGGRGRGPGMGPRRGGDQQPQNRPELTEEQKQQMEARRQEREEAMKKYDAELQQIMTPDQYKAYKADMEKRMSQGPRGFRPEEKKD